MKKNGKIVTKCEKCNKPISVYPSKPHICKACLNNERNTEPKRDIMVRSVTDACLKYFDCNPDKLVGDPFWKKHGKNYI